MGERLLKFLGYGGAFRPELGNTSAYYFDCRRVHNNLLLIDCGETTFEKLKEDNVLEKASWVDVLITHLHADNVGGLPSLIAYCNEIAKTFPVVIVYPEPEEIQDYLDTLEVNRTSYEIVKCTDTLEYSPDYTSYGHIRAVKQWHGNINAYGYIIEIGDKKIYYSGDSSSIPKDIYAKLLQGNYFDEFYQDVATYHTAKKEHLTVFDLGAMVPDVNIRKKITAMHYDDLRTIRHIRDDFGFDILLSEEELKGIQE